MIRTVAKDVHRLRVQLARFDQANVAAVGA
jgi:hypothetical protein